MEVAVITDSFKDLKVEEEREHTNESDTEINLDTSISKTETGGIENVKKKKSKKKPGNKRGKRARFEYLITGSWYERHKKQSELLLGVSHGIYYLGVYRTGGGKKSADAYVTINSARKHKDRKFLDKDVVISGIFNQNRALDGQLVVVKVFTEDNRRTGVDNSKKYRQDNKMRSEKFFKMYREGKMEGIKEEELKYMKTGDEDKDKGGDDADADVENVDDRMFGKVVGILLNNDKIQMYVKYRKTSEDEMYCLMEEVGGTSQVIVAADSVKDKDTIYLVERIAWHRYHRFPLAAVLREEPRFSKQQKEKADDEQASDKANEEAIMLGTHGIITEEFGREAEQEVQSMITAAAEYGRGGKYMQRVCGRKDYTDEFTFTIDPFGSKDLDDAITYVGMTKDRLHKIRVNIADVSFYIWPETFLDFEARNRATSFYLQDRNIPMLPRALSEGLVSLLPGLERYAVTVTFYIDKDGTVVRAKHSTSIVHSVAQLDYEMVDSVISNPHNDISYKCHCHFCERMSQNKVIKSFESKACRKRMKDTIKTLAQLTQKIRKKRFSNGSLSLNRPKIHARHGKLVVEGDIDSPAHQLIEELMLLANKYVAETLYKKLGRLGLLRRHGPPLSSRLQASADILNLPISTQSNCLAESIHSSVNNIADPEYKRLVIHILTSAMRNAVYFCPSNIVHPADYHHFALNSNFYTHFTSPLRRYPDLIVHRMLLFNHAQLPKLSDLDSIVHLCNLKSMRSRLIQRLLERTAVHSHLFSSFDSPLCLTAHITRLYETKFSFVILDYNIEDDIQLNSLSISTHSNSNLTASLDLWVYNYHFRSLSLLLNFTHSKQSKSPTTPASVSHSYKILTLSIGSKFQLLVSPLSPDSGPKYTYQLLLA